MVQGWQRHRDDCFCAVRHIFVFMQLGIPLCTKTITIGNFLFLNVLQYAVCVERGKQRGKIKIFVLVAPPYTSPWGGVAFWHISRCTISCKSGNAAEALGVAQEISQQNPWHNCSTQSVECKGAIFTRAIKATQGGFTCPCKYGAAGCTAGVSQKVMHRWHKGLVNNPYILFVVCQT